MSFSQSSHEKTQNIQTYTMPLFSSNRDKQNALILPSIFVFIIIVVVVAEVSRLASQMPWLDVLEQLRIQSSKSAIVIVLIDCP